MNVVMWKAVEVLPFLQGVGTEQNVIHSKLQARSQESLKGLGIERESRQA